LEVARCQIDAIDSNVLTPDGRWRILGAEDNKIKVQDLKAQEDMLIIAIVDNFN